MISSGGDRGKMNDSTERPSRIWRLIAEMEDIISMPGREKCETAGKTGSPGDEVVFAVANVLSLPLSQAARILLISSLLRSSGRELNCRFNELASLSGLSERTAYRALKEIKQSGFFEIQATPGIGVRIAAEWLWGSPCEGAKRILENDKTQSNLDQNIIIASPKE